MKTDKTKLATLSGELDMNEWGIYNAAHKMMETQHWGLRNRARIQKTVNTQLNNLLLYPFSFIFTM